MAESFENQVVSKKDVLVLLERIFNSYSRLENFDDCGALLALKELIEALPSEDDEPKIAKWIESDSSPYTSPFNIAEMVVECSHCGQEVRLSRASIYCPTCGYRMIKK